MDKEKAFLEILNGIPSFPKKDKEDISEYIQHNEWGIALETICSIILEDKIVINKQTFEKISVMGTLMDMDASLWNNIQRLISC